MNHLLMAGERAWRYRGAMSTPAALSLSHPLRRSPAFPQEAVLRSACVVEYSAGPGAPDGSDGLQGQEDVLLTVFVRRCLLHPTKVRIVEV